LRAKYKFKRKEGELAPLANSLISNFVGECKQKKVQIVITETVKEESDQKLLRAVNRYFDKAGIFSHPLRFQVFLKCRKRLIDLFQYCKCITVSNPKVDIVRNIYKEFAKKPSLRDKLVKLKEKKKRHSILPSETDMKILAEAATLAENNNVVFITDDGDYLEFKDELEKKLHIRICAVLEVQHLNMYNAL